MKTRLFQDQKIRMFRIKVGELVFLLYSRDKIVEKHIYVGREGGGGGQVTSIY